VAGPRGAALSGGDLTGSGQESSALSNRISDPSRPSVIALGFPAAGFDVSPMFSWPDPFAVSRSVQNIG
jgi:hypothetical protein